MRRPNCGALSLSACLLVLCFCSQTALATTAVVPKDVEMIAESRAIVMGRVTGISTSADLNTQLVYSYIQVDVNAVLKGQISEREIVLKELGGETRHHGTMVFGMPNFEVGQEVLVYLDTWPDGALRAHQGFLGKFDITRDPSTGRLFVERRIPDQNVVILAASENATNRSELEAYTHMIADSIKTNRVRMHQFEQRYYRDVPLLSQPIEFRSPGAAAEFTPQWTLINPSSPARWFEPDSNQPVVFYVNSSGAPSFSQLQNDIQAAMDAWSTSGALIRVTYGGSTGGCGVQVADGLNTISFNNCDNYFAPSQGCSGLLAVSGIVRYLPKTTKTVGGITYGKAVEANMSINPYALCNFTNRCQLQEVVTHEMGHALGLGHTTDTTATMWPFAHNDSRCSTLMADDVKGIAAIYPGGSVSGKLSIMTTDLPSADTDADYSANLEATGGSGVYHWSLVSGQMPSGLQLGMNGLLFGRIGASGSFDFLAQVADSSGNASQKAFTLFVAPPGLPPLVNSAEYRKKKTFVSGQGLKANAMVYVDGEGLSATLDGTMLITMKRKLKPGLHLVYVVNPDGKQSNVLQLTLE